ncbi:hypothetical protein SAMN05443270_2998 [Lacrimispora sphenoides]|uniref:phage tail protein n=1 Tax=Lacrimispora sphenoides TaxID=29370 RepID=UPI0008D6D08B|nr:phage tail protein [Lacrimispora sphenoides]SEU08070.1 hypothetical protein SAMN05443270_2998 [Lacrimispora sphenoides]
MVKFDAYNRPVVPRVFLSYPNKKLICQLNAKSKSSVLYIVGVSQFKFSIYKYHEKIENQGYDDISVGKYIWLEDVGWYRITDISEKTDGGNPYREITCYDLSYELKQTYLTSFGSMGTEDDEQGGLDRYAIYDANDKLHSIAHIFMDKNPGWKFKHIDPAISKNRRSFDNDSVTSYDFLTGDVSETFECIFVFDSNDRSVSVYKAENIGKEVSIALSFRNLVKELNITWNEDDIKTALYVTGGNDASGTALSIASVNPGGNNYITNFSYFYNDMSVTLKNKLEEYYQRMESSKGLISTALSQLKTLQDELDSLNNKIPTDESSTNWSQYGLVGLKAKSNTYKEQMSVLTDKRNSDPVAQTQYNNYNTLWNAVNTEITVRQSQITAKEGQIKAKQTEAQSYVVKINEILGEELYHELQPFVREDNLCDNSYIATSTMTEAEILEMKQDLYNHGAEELNRVCYPQFDMEVNSVNFPVLFKYKEWTDQLQLGDILAIKYSDDEFLKARLLKMEIDWEDFSKFKLTFSSKSSITDGWFDFVAMQKLADKTSTALKYNTSGWNQASKKAEEAFYSTQKEFLDLSNQQIESNGKNQEVLLDNTGILLKKWLPDLNKYAPEKLWITNRQILLFEEPEGTNLRNPKLAIGKVYVTNNGVTTSYYGISADVVYGGLFIGEALKIKNKNNTLTLDENGFTASATNGFKVQINPDNPSQIFSISENANKLLYVDANTKKLVFKGRAEIDEGLIGGWTIANNKLYSGGVGMSSDATPGAIAHWAGNATPSSAPYWLNNQGKLHASNVEITGGSLTIGNNFSVNNAGNLTANSVNITNGVLNIGNGLFRANYGGVYFGDYYVSADGSGTLRSSNGYVNITDIVTGGPSGELARMTIGSDLMNNAVEILGTGDIVTARVTCRHDYYFTDPWTAKMGALDMFKQIYNRLDAIRYSIRNMGGNVDWD